MGATVRAGPRRAKLFRKGDLEACVILAVGPEGRRSAPAGFQQVEWTSGRTAQLLDHVRVDHCGTDILVAK